MIVDLINSKLQLFDGKRWYDIQDTSTDYVLGRSTVDSKMVLNKFLGIIHFSSKYTYTSSTNSKTVRKETSSFINNFPKILTKTKKLDQKIDMYAILRVEEVKGNTVFCDVISYLGEVGNIELEKNIMKMSCTSHWNFSKKLLSFDPIDLTPQRKDYTAYDCYSIDPENCVDIDDALHCIRKENGYQIGIHIADVSSYIAQDSDLDLELRNRVETIYLSSDGPINMIPDELSIGKISLLEGNAKAAFSVIMELDDSYKIKSVSYEKTMVKVKNLSYELAQEMISSNETLLDLYTIGEKLKEIIKLCFRDDAIYDIHQMVEVYMIFANKFVAEKIHEYDENKVLLRTQKTRGRIKKENVDKILLEKHNSHLFEQARYQIGSHECEHQSLNLKLYTHFTSPLRRYADVIVHRQLYQVISCNKSIDEPSVESLFLLNFYGKFYKQMKRYQDLIDVADELRTECEITDAYVTYLSDSNIKLYVPKYNLDYDYTINYLIENIICIEEAGLNSVAIKNIQNGNETRLILFQKIKVKLIVSQRSKLKLKLELL
jgi:exoribonuclease R